MGRVRLNKPHVLPYIAGLAPAARKRVRRAIRSLAHGPRPSTLDLKLLYTDPTGPRYYRIRVGVHRIVYSVDAETVYIHRAFHRDEGYGWLERR